MDTIALNATTIDRDKDGHWQLALGVLDTLERAYTLACGKMENLDGGTDKLDGGTAGALTQLVFELARACALGASVHVSCEQLPWMRHAHGMRDSS